MDTSESKMSDELRLITCDFCTEVKPGETMVICDKCNQMESLGEKLAEMADIKEDARNGQNILQDRIGRTLQLLGRADDGLSALWEDCRIEEDHDTEDCPEDDTCECESQRHINDLFGIRYAIRILRGER